jgi:hypothetical protein
MSRLAQIACSSIAALCASCADDGLYVDLRLVPDPDVSTREQVVALVETVVVVVDSPAGLYAPGDDRVVDGMQIENADADPALELVAIFPVVDHLPWIRIERGSLEPDVALEVRVLGLPTPSGEPIAYGAVSEVRFDSGEVDVPFDLLPAVLPPRVVEVVPGDGDALDASCVVDQVVVILSKPVDPRTVLAPGAIAFEPGGAPRSIRVDDTARFIDVVPPSTWAFTTEARYALTISSRITDLEGRALDQMPAVEGAQDYAHEFALACQ